MYVCIYVDILHGWCWYGTSYLIALAMDLAWLYPMCYAKYKDDTAIECTLYIIFYLCYGYYLTTSCLALKGFQDSNSLAHEHEYFNFHLCR